MASKLCDQPDFSTACLQRTDERMPGTMRSNVRQLKRLKHRMPIIRPKIHVRKCRTSLWVRFAAATCKVWKHKPVNLAPTWAQLVPFFQKFEEKGADGNFAHAGGRFCKLANNAVNLLHPSDFDFSISQIDVIPKQSQLLARSHARQERKCVIYTSSVVESDV